MTAIRDPVGLALASLATGSCAGAAVITAGTILLRSTQLRQPGPDVGTGFNIMSVSLILGILTAVISGFVLTRRLAETWRRAVVGGLGVFGASILAGLAAPADMLGGRLGLAAYLVCLIGLAVVAWHAASRAASR